MTGIYGVTTLVYIVGYNMIWGYFGYYLIGVSYGLTGTIYSYSSLEYWYGTSTTAILS